MTNYLQHCIVNTIGCITLDRPQALNALSLQMVRDLTTLFRAWRYDDAVTAVLIDSSSTKAFCAGGDIRFFHQVGTQSPSGGSALLEDFFTEEYALNYLTHFFPKPIITLLDGIVMGGGMGLAQNGPQCRIGVVTERTKMAMPEVSIGLFPDVGGSYFLSRAAGQTGTFIGLTGTVIDAADALYCGLADVFVPASELDTLRELVLRSRGDGVAASIHAFAAAYVTNSCTPADNYSRSNLAQHRSLIDQHFGFDTVVEIMDSLASDSSAYAQLARSAMLQRSPLMLCVTLEALRRGASLDLADCLRMERTMVRRAFEHGEVLEGIRAAVIDKNHRPAWNPAQLDAVQSARIAHFFETAWPAHAHPLRGLG